MPIRRLLQESAFAPQEVQVLSDAFEAALRELRLVDRTDPAVELVAKRIMQMAQQGERDPGAITRGSPQGHLTDTVVHARGERRASACDLIAFLKAPPVALPAISFLGGGSSGRGIEQERLHSTGTGT
jgi:hypothetical protein